MACFRLAGAVCAVSLAFLSTTTAAQFTSEPSPARSPAAVLWQLRSGLNVAALSCRGPQDDAIVAGYNRLLAEHREELAATYRAVTTDYAGPAAFDEAMTRLYNRFAAPAAQAALCDAARVILDETGAHPETALRDMAAPAFAMIEGALAAPAVDALPPVALALAAAPAILPDADPEY